MPRPRVLAACLPLVVIAACRTSEAPGTQGSAAPGTLASAFVTSAAEARVPRDLLVAIAKVEDGLGVPRLRTPHADDPIPTAGPLQLRRGALDTLARGALLVGASEDELRSDADRALTAGARVLAELGTKHGAGADLASWAPAIAELSGFADEAHRQAYVHEVFATLARGGSFDGRDGPIALEAHDLPPSLTVDLSTTLRFAADAEYPTAEWIPTSCTNKCATTRNGNAIGFIVIHDTEAGWSSSVATLQNDPGKSVQYIVGTDGRVAQFLTEEDITAWHSGNKYYNERSVGIEHVGYSTKPFPEEQYAASAKLVDYLAKKYDVPRDRAHVIGHDQVPNGNKIAQGSDPCSDSPAECEGNTSYGGASHHTDPGVWEWPTFMARISGTAKCNDATEHWTCSTGTLARFRCASDAIQVQTCASPCVPATTDGADGTCEVATTSTPTVPVATTDAGTTSSGEKATAAIRSDSGCAAAPAGRDGPSAVVGLALGAVALVRRRRRSVS